MATYTDSELRAIATSIDVSPERVQEHAPRFEAAALWFRLGRRCPDRPSPSEMRRKLKQIAGTARRLLEHLGVNDPADAPDGPGDPDVYDALTYAPGTDRVVVRRATERIGRLVEIIEAIEAARIIQKTATEAVPEVTRVGDLTVLKGHAGDMALNGWIASMMSIYKAITGSKPTLSVAAPRRADEGKPTGPFLRFLKATAEPVGLELKDVRSRVRAIHAQTPEQN